MENISPSIVWQSKNVCVVRFGKGCLGLNRLKSESASDVQIDETLWNVVIARVAESDWESEVLMWNWSRIPKNTRSRIFDSGSPIESFFTSHSC